MSRTPSIRRSAAGLVGVALTLAATGCGLDAAVGTDRATTVASASAATPPPTSTTARAATTSSAPRLATTSAVTAAPTTSAARPSTTTGSIVASTTTIRALPTPTWTATNAAFDALVPGNLAVSLTVLRDGGAVVQRATGARPTGEPVTTETPLVLASVSKLITALTIARLAEQGTVSLESRLPWDELAIAHDPGWVDVTVGELLAHTSGMPVNRASWLDDPGPCTVPLSTALATPPTSTRGTWRYSNGNYCLLGKLIETVTGETIDAAAQRLVFDLVGVERAHLTTRPQPDIDGPYALGVARLERLGGAGAWMASTDDVARMLASITESDRRVLLWPGVIVDQYGWGHTGTVDGAKACAWVLDGGRTIVVAVVAGNEQATGGDVCDLVVTGVATDLGTWSGEPVRSPD